MLCLRILCTCLTCESSWLQANLKVKDEELATVHALVDNLQVRRFLWRDQRVKEA